MVTGKPTDPLSFLEKHDRLVGLRTLTVYEPVSRWAACDARESLAEPLGSDERDDSRQNVALVTLRPRHTHDEAQWLSGLERHRDVSEARLQLLEVVFKGVLPVALVPRADFHLAIILQRFL